MQTQYQIPGDTTQLFIQNSGQPIRSYALTNQMNQPVIVADPLGIVIDTVVPGQTSNNSGNWQTLTAFTAVQATYGQAVITVSDQQSNQPSSQSNNPTGPAAYNYLDFSVTTADIVNVPLGFTARTVVVDNPGGRWLYLPDAKVTIPPYWTGSILQLPFGPTEANVITTTAPPAGQVNSGSGSQANVRYYDGVVAPQFGGSMQQAVPPASIIKGSFGNQYPASSVKTFTITFDPGLTNNAQYYIHAYFVSVSPGSGAASTYNGVGSFFYGVNQVTVPFGWTSTPATNLYLPVSPSPAITYTTGAVFTVTFQTFAAAALPIDALSISVGVNLSPVL